ncbi:hypothetical protein KP79_PYT18656 [Mizuhopecten yessoensis]|uniref:DUF547 domain-containing protein n=2 Tax=Mizuhopecten yessoensis TaxID=6573 RepID=A0A210QLU5_MIZYE|nr:hypothetical protein KP79_PYT18656 [Mizuhopecten yessoensis]
MATTGKKEDIMILNPDPPPKQETGNVSATKLSQQLQKLMLRMKGECMQEDGKGVDYSKLKDSPSFKEYKQEVAQLHEVELSELTDTQTKVFFINLYNALTIHGLGVMDTLPKSVLDVGQFWKITCYKIGKNVYSLDNMEHGILRGNRPHPATIDKPFDSDDPRLKYALKQLDPRIHFALVCGAVSCPAINVYTETNIDAALDSATKNFCAQEVSMFNEFDEIWLSRIFQWYRSDFGVTEIDVIK